MDVQALLAHRSFVQQLARSLLKDGNDADQVTLHVRSSDLPIGEHEGFGGWRKVIVGEARFDEFPR